MKYDDICLMPHLIAETVAHRPYTGEEISVQLRPNPQPVEAKRQQMTPEQVEDFARLVNKKCAHAFYNKSEWFMKCVDSKTNAGRDQLYIYISHWLCAYLTNREQFLKHI